MNDARERHRRACALFAELVDLAPGERDARLAALAAEDLTLHREVHAMLAADAGERGSFEDLQRALDAAVPAHIDASDPLLGSRLGGYLIDRLLAVGGMGRVYEARQDSPHRTVAIKLLDTRIVSRAALSRFRHEAEIMARLVHPGIAQIYEVGTQPNVHGPAPWFAMELVPNAATIVEIARERQLDVRERIELFLRVADAVHFGHCRGIIHRDLKPSNVLADRSATTCQPKIIDFGIARSTDSDIVLATHRTEVGEIVGTLQYMSPEQLAADPSAIDVRSDVYALGLLLYEMLTDHVAFEVRGLSVHDAMRVLATASPRRMRDVAPALRAVVSGDLETIVAKATERDVSRRYASVSDLAHDLRRYLAHEPISARPPSSVYAIRLFARRHRAMVWGAAATIAMLALGLVGTSIGLIQATRSERAADAARDNAEFDSYVANVMAAEAAMRTHDVKLARERLDAAPKAHRGWEWRHLDARVDRSIAKAEFGLPRPTLIEFSPDGAALAIGDVNGNVRIIDATTLQERWMYQGRGEVQDLAFSRDGARIAVACDSEGACVLDRATHAPIGEQPGHVQRVRFVDDDTVLLCKQGGIVDRWHVATGTVDPIANLSASNALYQRGNVGAASPDGELLVIGRADNIVLVRTADGTVECVFRLDPLPVGGSVNGWHACFSPDGRSLAVELHSRALFVRSLASREEHRVYIEGSGISSLSWSDDSKAVLVGDGHGVITVRDATTLEPMRDLLGHTMAAAGAAMRGDRGAASTIASVDMRGAVRLWSPTTVDLVRHHTNRAWVYCVAFAPDGAWFVAASGEAPSGDPMVASYETPSGRELWRSPPAIHPTIVWSVDVSSDGTTLVHDAGEESATNVRDARTGAMLRSPSPLVAEWQSRLRPHHPEYFVGEGTEARILRSLTDGRAIRRFPMEHLNENAMSPDGELLALSPRPGTGIEIYRIDAGDIVARIATPATVWSMQFSPDERHLAARCNDGTVYLWSTATWSLERTWGTDSPWGEQIAFEPGGRLFGKVLGGIRVWDVERGREILTLPTLSEPASKLAVSPNGAWLGVGCVNGDVLLFDAPLPEGPPPANR